MEIVMRSPGLQGELVGVLILEPFFCISWAKSRSSIHLANVVIEKREDSCSWGFPVKSAEDGILYEPFGLHKCSAFKTGQGAPGLELRCKKKDEAMCCTVAPLCLRRMWDGEQSLHYRSLASLLIWIYEIQRWGSTGKRKKEHRIRWVEKTITCWT